MEILKQRLLEDNTNEIQLAGYLQQEIIDCVNGSIPAGEVLIYPGAIKHIKKRHNDDFSKYFKKIPDIIESPDYVGINAMHENSIELVKVFDQEVLVAVKLDCSGYLFLSSMYVLNPGKVPKRLKTGRLIKISQSKACQPHYTSV